MDYNAQKKQAEEFINHAMKYVNSLVSNMDGIIKNHVATLTPEEKKKFALQMKESGAKEAIEKLIKANEELKKK